MRARSSLRPLVLLAVPSAALLLSACASSQQTSFSRASGTERQAAIDSLNGEAAPKSTEMARGQCWMKYENTKVASNLDEKLKLVEQCVADKKRQYPLVVQ